MRRGQSIHKTFRGKDAEALGEAAEASLYDLQNGLNSGTEAVGVIGDRLPKQRAGDISARFGPDYFIAIAVSDSRGNRREVMIPMDMATAGTAIADVPTGGSASAASNATAINSILALLRAIHLIPS